MLVVPRGAFPIQPTTYLQGRGVHDHHGSMATNKRNTGEHVHQAGMGGLIYPTGFIKGNTI